MGKQSTHICYICAKTYKNKYSLKLHMENHNLATDRPIHKCNTCGAWSVICIFLIKFNLLLVKKIINYILGFCFIALTVNII